MGKLAVAEVAKLLMKYGLALHFRAATPYRDE